MSVPCLALVLAQAAIFTLAAVPILVAIALGGPGIARASADPAIVAACLRSLTWAGASVALAWPAGLAAAFGIWGAPASLRRMTIGAALLTLLLPPMAIARGFGTLADRLDADGPHLAAMLVAHAAPAAGLVLVLMTDRLDRLDTRIIGSAAASGATSWQIGRLVLLPAVAGRLALAACAAFTVSMGQSVLDGRLSAAHHPTLAGRVDFAWRHHDVSAAPMLLLLSALAVAPLLPLGLVALLRIRIWPRGHRATGTSAMSARSAMPSP